MCKLIAPEILYLDTSGGILRVGNTWYYDHLLVRAQTPWLFRVIGIHDRISFLTLLYVILMLSWLPCFSY